jgi:hypothetical protein
MLWLCWHQMERNRVQVRTTRRVDVCARQSSTAITPSSRRPTFSRKSDTRSHDGTQDEARDAGYVLKKMSTPSLKDNKLPKATTV